jgi:ribosomal protein L34
VPKGLSQLNGYLARLGLDEGVLVVFDRRKEGGAPDASENLEEMATEGGRKVMVLRL